MLIAEKEKPDKWPDAVKEHQHIKNNKITGKLLIYYDRGKAKRVESTAIKE